PTLDLAIRRSCGPHEQTGPGGLSRSAVILRCSAAPVAGAILWLILCLLLWPRTCGGHQALRPRWNQPTAGSSRLVPSRQEHQIMTAEVRSAVAQPDQERCPAAVAHPPGRHRRGRLTSRGSRAPARTSADPLHDDPLVVDLVARARNGDKQAWDALVERYATLIWTICRRHRL